MSRRVLPNAGKQAVIPTWSKGRKLKIITKIFSEKLEYINLVKQNIFMRTESKYGLNSRLALLCLEVLATLILNYLHFFAGVLQNTRLFG